MLIQLWEKFTWWRWNGERVVVRSSFTMLRGVCSAIIVAIYSDRVDRDTSRVIRWQ